MKTRWWRHCVTRPDLAALPRPCHAVLVALLLAPLAALAAGPQVEYLADGGLMPEGLPFSPAVRVDDTVYLSGQVGLKPGTLELVEGGMAAQARQTMENIKATLESNGLTMHDVVKCTVMLADMEQWGAFNDVYRRYFSPPYPARSALGASGLALGAQVEVECLAVVGARRSTPSRPRPGPLDERVYRRPNSG